MSSLIQSKPCGCGGSLHSRPETDVSMHFLLMNPLTIKLLSLVSTTAETPMDKETNGILFDSNMVGWHIALTVVKVELKCGAGLLTAVQRLSANAWQQDLDQSLKSVPSSSDTSWRPHCNRGH